MNFNKKEHFRRNILKLMLFASLFLFSSLFQIIPESNNRQNEPNLSSVENHNLTPEFMNLKASNSNSVLFEGTVDSLNVTDYGYLTEKNQEIKISDGEQTNKSYYLDEENNWKSSKIDLSIDNIQDTRNWVNNSGFNNITVFRKNQTFESDHLPYKNHLSISWDNTIQETGALYIRAHFVNLSFYNTTISSETDFLYFYNATGYEYLEITGTRYDFYSPWVSGDEIGIYYKSGNQNNDYYGYHIDYYEFINVSSGLERNTANWKFDWEKSGTYGANTYGSGSIGGADAMFVGYHGDWNNYESFIYYAGSYSELYQENIIVPRGDLIDAYISFDYFLEYGFDTNNIIMYLEVNNKKVYSKGILDIIEAGKHQWHQTGIIPLSLWSNLTNVFEETDLNKQTLNISLGIKMLGDTGVQYSGYEDVFGNIIWFDNITLGIKSQANVTQETIDLTCNNYTFLEGNGWGKASLTLNDTFETNPILLSMNSSAPIIEFDLNTTITSYHNTTTNINQQYNEGVNYEILEDGSITWEFYHYLYMPPGYDDFEFIIKKPNEWEFNSVQDSFLQSRGFEGGRFGQDYIKINRTSALFSGWWTLRATSLNYLNVSNTNMQYEDSWDISTFYTSQSARIRTQLNHSNNIPPNLAETAINLTIYNPEGEVWHEDQGTPLSNGSVVFSRFYFDSSNTTGGEYNYTLIWNNQTALGGIQSRFILIHNASMTLLKPNDAVSDLTTEAFLGDIIPISIQLLDSENDVLITNAHITYNWTSGLSIFEEVVSGIYEAILDTSDLSKNGNIDILINSSLTGFKDYNLTLRLFLVEKTTLQRVSSESVVEYHDNSTVKFTYVDSNGFGIANAEIGICLSSSLYKIIDHLDGNYSIEFSTSYILALGTYQLCFNFSAEAYQFQENIFQFEVIEQSVNISVLLNNKKN